MPLSTDSCSEPYFQKEPYRGWEGKLKKILELTGLPYEPEKAPLKTVMHLRSLRDLIAHGKPEPLVGEKLHGPEVELPPIPPSTLRNNVATKEELEGILSDIEGFIGQIHQLATPLVELCWGGTNKAIWFGAHPLHGATQYNTRSTTVPEGRTGDQSGS